MFASLTLPSAKTTLRCMLVLTLVFVLLSVIHPAYAAGPQAPGLDGGPGTDPAKPITDVVNALTKVLVGWPEISYIIANTRR